MENLIKRVSHLVPVLLGVSLLVFIMTALTPGDPVDIMLGDQFVTEEQERLLRHDMGLDLPVHQRFTQFLWNAARGNFGISFFHRRPVSEVIGERLPATIELTLVAMLLAMGISIPLGVLAAVKKGKFLDKLSTVSALLGVSMPGFWFGILLLILFAVNLKWLPVAGRLDYEFNVSQVTGLLLIDTILAGRFDSFLNALQHILMPAITLGLGMAAMLMRVTRSSMLEVLKQDYVLFAESKGLSRRRVLFVHGLKNALIPTVTVAALETGSLLGGNMIVETVFGWPGLGSLVVEAIFARNYPLVQTATLIYASTYVLLNFIADLLYSVLNPRVRM
ncbi:MAG: ABC transporter permease [SAR324 cluster bacterium]|nr:ABC transporter permease [SAR324 cluster bacterium]